MSSIKRSRERSNALEELSFTDFSRLELPNSIEYELPKRSQEHLELLSKFFWNVFVNGPSCMLDQEHKLLGLEFLWRSRKTRRVIPNLDPVKLKNVVSILKEMIKEAEEKLEVFEKSKQKHRANLEKAYEDIRILVARISLSIIRRLWKRLSRQSIILCFG